MSSSSLAQRSLAASYFPTIPSEAESWNFCWSFFPWSGSMHRIRLELGYLSWLHADSLHQNQKH
jgi:hypothetical protein